MITLLWNSQRVELPNPEFGDQEKVPLNVIIHRSMNKIPYTFVQPTNNKILNYSFTKLSRVQVRSYFNLMRISQGKDVTMLDFKGQRWYGNITNHPTHSSHDGINNSNLEIVFEGVLVA